VCAAAFLPAEARWIVAGWGGWVAHEFLAKAIGGRIVRCASGKWKRKEAEAISFIFYLIEQFREKFPRFRIKLPKSRRCFFGVPALENPSVLILLQY
jgi:hypothetical protein